MIQHVTLDDEQLLFNPDCSAKILLDNIKRRCHLSQRGIYAFSWLLADVSCYCVVEIDLIDEDGELRQVSQLLQQDQQQSCGAFFTDRGIYYLIKLESESRDHNSWLLYTVARDR